MKTRLVLWCVMVLIGGVHAVAEMGACAEIAFLAPNDGQWKVRIVDRLGRARWIATGEHDVVHLSSAPALGLVLATDQVGRAVIIDASTDEIESLALTRVADEAAISPDGRHVLFTVSEENDGGGVWLFDRSAGRSEPIPMDGVRPHGPSWSSSGDRAVVAARTGAGGDDLFLIDVASRSVRQATINRSLFLEPTLTVDGTVYAVRRQGEEYDIWSVNQERRELERLLELPGSQAHPYLPPGRERLWFSSRDSGQTLLWTAGLDGASVHAWLDPSTEIRYPICARAARRPFPTIRIALLALTQQGGWQPHEVDLVSGDLEAIPVLPESVSRLTASADGALLLANTVDGRLYVSKRAGAWREISIEPSGTLDAAISPDGKQVAFSVNTLGTVDRNDIWVSSLSDGSVRKLTRDPLLQNHPTWADEQTVLYTAGRAEQDHDLWKVPSDGSGTPEVVIAKQGLQFEPSAGPAGRIVVSARNSGGYDLRVHETGADPPTSRTLVGEEGWEGKPSLSVDGRSVLYLWRRDGESTVWIFDVESQIRVRVPVFGRVRNPIWWNLTEGGA